MSNADGYYRFIPYRYVAKTERPCNARFSLSTPIPTFMFGYYTNRRALRVSVIHRDDLLSSGVVGEKLFFLKTQNERSGRYSNVLIRAVTVKRVEIAISYGIRLGSFNGYS